MDKRKYEEIKQTLKDVNDALARNDLTAKQRKDFEENRAALSGALLSVWLPMSNVRRTIMLILLLLGLRAFFNYDDTYIWYWLAIAFFSPKAVGLLAHGFGRLMGGFKK